jgi:hypothetical protein
MTIPWQAEVDRLIAGANPATPAQNTAIALLGPAVQTVAGQDTAAKPAA